MQRRVSSVTLRRHLVLYLLVLQEAQLLQMDYSNVLSQLKSCQLQHNYIKSCKYDTEQRYI